MNQLAYDPSAGFRIGVDVASSNDYPALAVVAPVEILRLMANGVPERDRNPTAHQTGRQGCTEGYCVDRTYWRYPVLTIRRLPRGRALRATGGVVVRVAGNLRAAHPDAPITVFVDRGGMGLGVFEDLPEMLHRADVADVTVYGVQITGGEMRPTRQPGRRYNTSKVALAGNLLRLVEAHLIELPRDLREGEAMVRELRAFKPKQTATTGALTFEAEKTGDHDDLIVALALALMVNPDKGRTRVVPIPDSWY
jgi:hypothetical protein